MEASAFDNRAGKPQFISLNGDAQPQISIAITSEDMRSITFRPKDQLLLCTLDAMIATTFPQQYFKNTCPQRASISHTVLRNDLAPMSESTL